jgi:hypothetical protein
MGTLKAARSAQFLLESEFVFDIAAGDQMANTSGVVTAFKDATGTVFDVINLMQGATLVGGEVVVETASNDSGASATIAVGDSNNTTRYLGATSIKAAARTALVPTGYRGAGENIRITLANANGDATAGKVTIRALFSVQGRANEVIPG